MYLIYFFGLLSLFSRHAFLSPILFLLFFIYTGIDGAYRSGMEIFLVRFRQILLRFLKVSRINGRCTSLLYYGLLLARIWCIMLSKSGMGVLDRCSILRFMVNLTT